MNTTFGLLVSMVVLAVLVYISMATSAPTSVFIAEISIAFILDMWIVIRELKRKV